MPFPAPLDVLPRPAVDALLFVWGAIWGSFVNVVIVRWPNSIVHPRSRCVKCLTPIAGYDNIPILSFLVLRGRCRHCKTRYSPRYLLVEILVGTLSLSLGHKAALGSQELSVVAATYASTFVLAGALVAIAFIDLERRLIPDVISLPGILVGLLFSLVLPTPGLVNAAIGAAGGYLLVWLVFNRAWKVVRKVEGMMMGDAKLLAMIGAFVGYRGALFALLLGSILGSVVGITAALRRDDPVEKAKGLGRVAVPFGPFLAIGALSYLFYGDRVIDWYLNLGSTFHSP